jgi:hypothetical protein
MSRLIVVATLVAVVGAFAVASPGVAGKSKVAVCHANDEGGYHEIEVSEQALPAHLGHGDGLVGDAVPGMEGFVFGEHCAIEEVEPPGDPIAAGCYESSTDQLDLKYLGPANTAGNAEFWASDDGSCSNFLAFTGVAVVTAADSSEASGECASLGLTLDPEPLNGAAYGYTGLPASAWLCV